MWPWEHVVVGYVGYSLFVRLQWKSTPGPIETLTVVFASLLPDLIDKPLAWEYDVFETGYAIGHSIFFAIPLCIAVGIVTRTLGRTRVGVAFAAGYLLHLPADVIPIYVRRGTLPLERILWPVESAPPDAGVIGFRDQFLTMVGQYRRELLAGDLATVEWAGLGIAVGAFFLWLADGAPLLCEPLQWLRRRIRSGRSSVGGPQAK